MKINKNNLSYAINYDIITNKGLDFYIKCGVFIILKISNLVKSYDKKVNAVDGISFDVNSGEIFGFLGPNGAGKTTTIKMITGLLKITSGNISISVHDVLKEPFETKKILGYVPDNPYLYDTLTGIEFLNFVGDIYNVPLDLKKERILQYSDTYKMTSHLNDFIRTYSNGMRKKLSIIGALLHEPQLLILDEPMMALDTESSFILKNHIKQHCANGNTVIFSTHVMEIAESFCDRVAIIDKGHLIAIGTIDEIRATSKIDGSLENIFLGLTAHD